MAGNRDRPGPCLKISGNVDLRTILALTWRPVLYQGLSHLGPGVSPLQETPIGANC